MEFRQIKTGLGITLITNETINSIAKVRVFEGRFSEIRNQRLYEINQKLLATAKNKNRSNEVGVLWDIVQDRTFVFFGNENSIDTWKNIEGHKELYNGPSRTMLWTHNHPRNTSFSSTDIASFIHRDALMAALVVCNDGRIHTLVKDYSFDKVRCLMWYNMSKEGEMLKNIIAHQREIGMWYRCSIPNKRRTL